jgi:hypothetical protein
VGADEAPSLDTDIANRLNRPSTNDGKGVAMRADGPPANSPIDNYYIYVLKIGIISISDSCARDEPNLEKCRELASRIARSARSAGEIIQRIRDMARNHEPGFGSVRVPSGRRAYPVRKARRRCS